MEPKSLWVSNLHRHCVSRPPLEDFARFLNHHSDLQPHCVSRRGPVDSTQGSPRRRLVRSLQPSAQPILPVIVRVVLPPGGTGPTVALALAVRGRAGVLAITRSRMGLEPSPTDPARTLANHAGTLLAPSMAKPPSGYVATEGRDAAGPDKRRFIPGEQTRVIPGER